MTVFQGLVILDRRHGGTAASARHEARASTCPGGPITRHRTVLAVAAILTLSILGIHSVRFDHNLLNLQAAG
jgi:hypothetical protein